MKPTQEVVVTLERVQKEDLKTGPSGIFPPSCKFSCMPSTTSEETSATDVCFGDLFGVGGLDQSRLWMWSSLQKDPKRRPQHGSFFCFSPIATFLACPAPRWMRPAPLMLAFGTPLVSLDSIRANSRCGHHTGRIQKEDLNVGLFGIFPPRSCCSFHACPTPRQSRQAPLMLALGTSLVLVDWIRANS